MTNRFFSPNQQFMGNTGLPLAGYKLYFYATGTSTPQTIYSDYLLTAPVTNPVILDSNGYAGNVFLNNLGYKVVLTDSNDVVQWTEDPVWASDYSTFAQIKPWSGNPNGLVAGVQGIQGALPGASTIWDYANNILYICTTTGTSGTAVWTAVNAATATNYIAPPAGRLTNSSGQPILGGDVTGSTAVYFTPYYGNTIPIYNGTSFALNTFTELTLALVASHAANTIYDVFVFNNGGVLTMVTGPAWTNSGAGTSTRGSGGGTTQLALFNGFYVNNVQITGRNGSTTYTIAANTALYVGSILIDSGAGAVSCYTSYGQNRSWGVWNYYNRIPILMKAGDGTASWAYGTNTIRASNGSASNKITMFSGQPSSFYDIQFIQKVGATPTATNPGTIDIGIGINSVAAFSGLIGETKLDNGAASAFTDQVMITAAYKSVPLPIGVQTISCLERVVNNASSTTTYFGTEPFMLLSTRHEG